MDSEPVIKALANYLLAMARRFDRPAEDVARILNAQHGWRFMVKDHQITAMGNNITLTEEETSRVLEVMRISYADHL